MINLRTINLAIFSLLSLSAVLAALSIIPKPTGPETLKWTWFMSSIVFSGAVGVILAWRQAQKAAWLASLLLLSGAEARRKQSRARVIQVLARTIGSIAAIIIALGVFGLLIR